MLWILGHRKYYVFWGFIIAVKGHRLVRNSEIHKYIDNIYLYINYNVWREIVPVIFQKMNFKSLG